MPNEGVGDEVFYSHFIERIKSGKLHKSPLEEFVTHNPTRSFYELHEELEYNGTVGSAIDQLQNALQEPSEEGSHRALALRPTNILRGVIDWNVSHPNNVGAAIRVKDAIDIGLATYAKDYPAALSNLSAYKGTLAEEVLGEEVHQPGDAASWTGYEPDYSYKTAMELAFKFPGKSLLLLALGQGSIPAAMDVFLRHAGITEDKESSLYAVRFSRNKKKDEHPLLAIDEIDYLNEVSQNKQIVLLEEDTITAETLQQGTNFFRKYVFPNQPVYPKSNYKASSKSSAY